MQQQARPTLAGAIAFFLLALAGGAVVAEDIDDCGSDSLPEADIIVACTRALKAGGLNVDSEGVIHFKIGMSHSILSHEANIEALVKGPGNDAAAKAASRDHIATAIKELERARALSPRAWSRSTYTIAELQIAAGDYDSAVKNADELIRVMPTDIPVDTDTVAGLDDFLALRVNALEGAERIDEAKRDLETLLDHGFSFSDALLSAIDAGFYSGWPDDGDTPESRKAIFKCLESPDCNVSGN